MDRAVRSTKFKFVDMRPITQTEKFVNDDYTEAVVGDIGCFLGAINQEELVNKMKVRFHESNIEAL